MLWQQSALHVPSQVLDELVHADGPLARVDDMDGDARDLFDELLERYGMIARGELDLDRDFDDFRLVVGRR